MAFVKFWISSNAVTQDRLDALRQTLLEEIRAEISDFDAEELSREAEQEEEEDAALDECMICMTPLVNPDDESENYVALKCGDLTEERKYETVAHRMHRSCYEDAVGFAGRRPFRCPLCRDVIDRGDPYFDCGRGPSGGLSSAAAAVPRRVNSELVFLREAEAKVEEFITTLAQADTACIEVERADPHRLVFWNLGEEENEIIRELWDRASEIGAQYVRRIITDLSLSLSDFA